MIFNKSGRKLKGYYFIYLIYFICTLLGIKESYFNSTLTFPFIKVNSDQTSLQYKRIGCTQALKSLICPYMFILSDNKDTNEIC
jgi:hypothetical protein